MQPPSFALAESLERHLGDPDDEIPFSTVRSLAHDETETFPTEACHALESWGIQNYYVPSAHGGSLARYEDALQLMRVVARRDLTVAIGHGKTYLGAVCAWVGADPAQAAALGRRVRDRAVVSLCLTERAHGSDLLSSEFAARRTGGGFLLDGEKWLINNASRGDVLCLLAATDTAGGPRSMSLFLVDRHALPEGTVRSLPKVLTHGIRGADISGIALRQAPVPVDALVGEVGGGLEILLKALQVTRTMCTSLSLGAGDTALRLACRFALERRLHGRTLVQLPQARRTLAEAYADLLLAEVVAISAARGIDALPGEASVSSAVAKYLVPSSMDATIARLGGLLGARAFLMDVHARGLFQKVERDHRIVGLFDGNTLVNLQGLVTQGRSLARGFNTRRTPAVDLEAMFALTREPSNLDPSRLRLASAQGSSVLNAFPDAVAQLAALTPDTPGLRAAADLARRVLDSCQSVHASLASPPGRVSDIGPEAFAAAKRYALCFAAASSVLFYLHNHEQAGTGRTSELWDDATWLRAVLGRLLWRLHGPDERAAAHVDALAEPLLAQTRTARLFSLFDLDLAEGARC